jgi:hypothetical protein
MQTVWPVTHLLQIACGAFTLFMEILANAIFAKQASSLMQATARPVQVTA